jgi:hypothetical protein
MPTKQSRVMDRQEALFILSSGCCDAILSSTEEWIRSPDRLTGAHGVNAIAEYQDQGLSKRLFEG